VPRRGYRFIAPVERLNGNAAAIAEAKPEPSPRRTKQWRWLAGAGVTAVLLVAALGGWRAYHSPKKTLNFGPRDWVLISSFENRTGNPLLDGTLEHALGRELSNSQFVNVVPRERAGDALRLMRKPLDTKIDAALGREICLRDGGIRALLTGRVEKLGTTYVMSANLVNPENGVTVASLSEEDAADSQMAAAIRRLSNRVRETLGEKRTLVQQSNQRLEKVTTPSLRALQLYSRADELMRTDQSQAEAGELLKQAVAEDPNFASAHMLLGWTYANREKYAEAKTEFQRALDLADTTSDRERLFIQGSYYENVEKNSAMAKETYEALLRLYPDHYWAANEVKSYYLDRGQWDDFWRFVVRIVDLRPDDLRIINLAACGMYANKNLDGAKPYVERSRKLVAAGALDLVDVEVLPISYKWSQGDITEARSDFLKLRGTAKQHRVDPFLFWSFGELAEVEKLAQNESDWFAKNALLGMNFYLKGDLPEAKKHFREMLKDPKYGGYWPQVVGPSGLWSEVEKNIRKASPDSPLVQIIQGEDALERGQTQKAITLLEKGIAAIHTLPTGAFYTGSEALARAYEWRGNFEAALRVLRQASDAKGKTYNCFSGFMSGAWWQRDKLQLADLYRKMNRIREAEQVENELRKMLIYADPDHPIVLALKEREILSTSIPRQN